MTLSLNRGVVVGALTTALALAAIVAGMAMPSQQAQAQPNPSMFAQQPPAACVCASAVPIFAAGGPLIAHCQCGALSCAAATASGGVTLHCGR